MNFPNRLPEDEAFLKCLRDEKNYFSKLMTFTGHTEDELLRKIYEYLGRREILLTDLYFRWSEGQRAYMQHNKFSNVAFQQYGLTEGDKFLFDMIRKSQFFLNDLYYLLQLLETKLHESLYDQLIKFHGDTDWWRKGIPLDVRKMCSARYEEDDFIDEWKQTKKSIDYNRYCYSSFIDLHKIIKFKDNYQQLIQSKFIPKPYRIDPQKLASDFAELNRTRNAAMHPIKPLKYREEMFKLLKETLKNFKYDFN